MAAHHFIADADDICAKPLREEFRFFELAGKPLYLLFVVLHAKAVGRDPCFEALAPTLSLC